MIVRLQQAHPLQWVGFHTVFTQRVFLFMPLMFAMTVFAQTSRPADALFLIDAKVVKRHEQRGMVAMNVGHEKGVTVSDPFWMFDQSQLTAQGHVFLVTPNECVGRLTNIVGKVSAGASAVIVPETSVFAHRMILPEGVTLHGQLVNLPPGRRTAWIDLGSKAGLRLADTLLVSRNGIPIARGRVSMLEDETALTTLRPLVGNTLPQPGDVVGLWPEPYQKRFGKIDSAILDVKPDSEGVLVTLVGTAADGLQPDRLVDLFRDGHYVGVAELIEISDPLSIARMIESASAQMPEVGDRAIVRSGPTSPAGPLAAAVFRVVEGDYCLVAAGESDGVRIGEQFIVHRRDPENPNKTPVIAELIVQTAKVHHCGCDVRLLGKTKIALLPWDWAVRVDPPWPSWTLVGVVSKVDTGARSAVVDIDDGTLLARSQVVCLVPSADDRHPVSSAAIVIHIESQKARIYIPPGWGNIAEWRVGNQVRSEIKDRK